MYSSHLLAKRFALKPALCLVLALFAFAFSSRPAQAQAVLNPAGGSVVGTLDTNTTSIAYSYAVTKDEDATLSITTSAGLSAYLRFYDTDTTSEIVNVYVDSGQNRTLGIPHLGPGTYFVRVIMYSGSGTFTLSSAVTPPVAANDAEPNNDAAHAHAFAVSSATTGHLGYSRASYNDLDPDDWYTVVVPQDSDQTYTLTTDSTLEAYIRFYDADGTSEVGNVYVDYAQTRTLTIPHLAPGVTYYVRINRYGGYGGYTLSNAKTAPAVANDTEPNNAPQSALALAVNTTRTGHLGYSRASYNDLDPDDWYAVTVPKDGDEKYTLTTDSTLEAYVRFYDSDGTSEVGNVYVDYGQTGSLAISHLAPGATYYVRINRYSGYGGYTFQNVHTPQAIVNDTEINDSPLTAINLHNIKGFTGHLGYSRSSYSAQDNDDWYAFQVPQDGDVNFTVTTTSALTAYIRFYDADGVSEVGNVYVDAGQTGALTAPHLAPGATYYVRINRYSGYGGYTAAAPLAPVGEVNDPEPNNGPGQAVAFAPDSIVHGHLGYSRTSFNDVDNDDWYSFITPRDSDVTFTLTTDGSLTSYVRFYDSDGSSEITNLYVNALSAGSLTIPHLAPGATYYVRINRYTGFGGYTLENAVAPLFVANDRENDDTAANANALASLNNISGHLGYSRTSYGDLDNDDWYTVNLPVGSFSVNMTVASPLTAYLRLYAPDGSNELTNTYNGGGNVTLGYNIVTAGTYFLRVNRYSSYGAYVLNQPVTATVAGFLTLDTIVQNAPQQTINVDFRTPGTTSVLFTRPVSVGYNGNYFLANVPRGKYDLAFKGAKWLRKVIKNVDVNVGDATNVNVFLPGGDANNDNMVDIADFGLLVNAYNGDITIPGTGYDVRPDFTCDGVIDIGDFGILVNHYNETGAL